MIINDSKVSTNILITGAGSGMGAAAAERLAALGAKIAVLDINEAAAHKTAEKIGGLPIVCDITNETDVEKAFAIASSKLGDIRVAINCAGIIHARRVVNKAGMMPTAEFRKVIEVNLIGTFNILKYAAAHMMKLSEVDNAERGVIINTASIAAFEGQVGQTGYSASKGGVVALTLPAAREFAPFGIRVMTIAPGLVDTPMFEQLSEEARAQLHANVPFPKRLAQPSEYAHLVQHIIENAMLNGTVIRLDGALRLQ